MTERRNLLQESLIAIERLQAKLAASERAKHQSIAIIGAGCRYPGGITTPEELWRVVRDGVDVVSEIPQDRWNVDAYYDPDPKAPGKMVTKRGGFLRDVDRFDPHFFGISPREASMMDPQQRLLLETSYEALQSAGLAVDRLVGSTTGVFVGITTSDYAQMLRLGGPENSDVYSATGGALNVAAGRVAFTFGFQGPCVALDTACSSSLVAVHLACQSLRTGESDLVLAGGVNVVLQPDAMILFSKWGMMAPDGACKTFDAAADGFVRSEGCAVIALKRLADAIADGDPVLGVICGSATNSDGRSSGLTVPNGPAQEAVLKEALANAQLSPADIDYVEAHGTGTSLGDPIEIEALGNVMGRGRSSDKPLVVGSVKTNLGHTEASSGLAGLLKVVMALKHEAIPRHLHFSTPNPRIPWAELPISVATKLMPWPRSERPRHGGVSSFGFSGTNAHVILGEAPLRLETASAASLPEMFLIPLSARDDTALRELARKTADALAADPTLSLADVATTLSTGRVHMSRRMAIVTDSIAELKDRLATVASGQTSNVTAEGTIRPVERSKIAFLFTGQGAQYPGMARGLYESEPVFRAVIDKAAAVLETHLDRPLLDLLLTEDLEPSILARTAYTQPALFAVEVALAELWRSWGIVPAVVAGHSVGEYAAACVAGVFTFEAGLRLIAERGKLMQALPVGGAMAAIFASETQVAAQLRNVGNRLAIAAVNGPNETVISGEAEAVERALADFVSNGIEGRRLDVSHAFHSPLLDPMLEAFEQRAAEDCYAEPRVPLVSNVTGELFQAGDRPDARYWRRHGREPVRFAACVENLRAMGVTSLVEVGPHPTLLPLAKRVAPEAAWTAVASLRKGQNAKFDMLGALAQLYVRGLDVRWDALTSVHGSQRVALPTYPFQRERYWLTNPQPRARASALDHHPLLGERIELAAEPGLSIWENEIDLESHPWLRDHRVQGSAIVPATAYIEMAIAAGGEALGPGSLSVKQIEIAKPIILNDGDVRRLQVTLKLQPDGSARFAVHSRQTQHSGKPVGGQPSTLHVTAQLGIVSSPKADVQRLGVMESARERCRTVLDGSIFYKALEERGNEWGPCFRGMEQVWQGENEAVGRIRIAPALSYDVARYCFHPAVSDACGHVLVATMPSDPTDGKIGGAFVGGGVGEVRFHRSPVGDVLWARAKLRPMTDPKSNVVVGDVEVFDATGALVSETIDAKLWYLDESSSSARIRVPEEWYHRLAWHAKTMGEPTARAAAAGLWLIFADRGGIAERILASRHSSGLETLLVKRGSEWSCAGDRAIIRSGEAEDYAKLLGHAGRPTAILHLWSLDSVHRSGDADPFDDSFATGPESLLHLLHGLNFVANNSRPRIWLVTGGAQAVVPADKCEAPWNAAMWGLGKTLSVEHSEFWGGLIDLEAGVSSDVTACRLITEVETADKEDKIAFRSNLRYVPRLVRHESRNAVTGEFSARADSTYLVTGGLGGIGLAMARWLVECGARQLLLLARTPLPPRQAWAAFDPESEEGRRTAAVVALEKFGANVETAAVDVADEEALARCLDIRREQGKPPVRGIIHAAGILQFETLATQDVASLRRGLHAKAKGAWVLHRLFDDEDLEIFTFCSSSSALLNSPLLGGYAAGNAFLDALAHHRRGQGRTALSVNWGTWGEVGMAVEAGRGARDDMLRGASTISTARGLSALRELLIAREVQAAVMPVDWAEFARCYPIFAADPLLEHLVNAPGSNADDGAAAGLTRGSVLEASGDARLSLVRNYLRIEAARVLGAALERFDTESPLSSWGFDSLMAVQLKNRIEVDLGVIVPMIEFLQGSSVDQLAPSVCEAVQSGPILPEDAKDVEVWEEGSL